MRALRFHPELWLLLVTACGPGDRNEPSAVASTETLRTTQSIPEPRIDPRVARIDQQIASLDAIAADEDPRAAEDLDARIAQDQETILSLNTEAATEQSTQSDELQNLRFREEQESALIRDRLKDLTDLIRGAEQTVAFKQQAMASFSAPPESDAMKAVVSDLALAQARLDQLRSQYSDLLADQNAAPAAFFADQSQELDAVRARRTDLAVMIADVQTELSAAIQARNQITAQRTARAKQLQDLRSERDQLTATQ